MNKAWRAVRLAATFLGCVGLLAGCMTPGQRLEKTALDQLREGQPRAEVHRIFGKPGFSESGANGRTLDEFWFVMNRPRLTFGLSTNDGSLIVRSLYVLFDPQGQVERFKSHEASSIYNEGFWGGVRIGRQVTQEQMSRIQKGQTRRSELIEWFGSPVVVGLDLEGDAVLEWPYLDLRPFVKLNTTVLVVHLDGEDRVRDFNLQNRR